MAGTAEVSIAEHSRKMLSYCSMLNSQSKRLLAVRRHRIARRRIARLSALQQSHARLAADIKGMASQTRWSFFSAYAASAKAIDDICKRTDAAIAEATPPEASK